MSAPVIPSTLPPCLRVDYLAFPFIHHIPSRLQATTPQNSFMSTTSTSQKRSKSRPVDLPGFTGKADRLGLDKTVVKKRKQPATGVKQEEPRRKKPRSEQKRGQRVYQESGDARLPVDRPSPEVAACSAELAVGRTKLAVNRGELVGIETEVEPGQAEVKVEMSESDHSCRRTLTDLPVEVSPAPIVSS
jgi:hypothetical protein